MTDTTNDFANSEKFDKLTSIINFRRRFPENVFTRTWDNYLFFESDVIFSNIFLTIIRILLTDSNTSFATLVNIGVSDTTNGVQGEFVLTKKTKGSDYRHRLLGDGAATNWIYCPDRYVCVPEKPKWCIYCERNEDIAVFAYNSFLGKSAFEKVNKLFLSNLKHQRIDVQPGFLFNTSRLLPNWRERLVAEYPSIAFGKGKK